MEKESFIYIITTCNYRLPINENKFRIIVKKNGINRKELFTINKKESINSWEIIKLDHMNLIK